MDAHRQTRDESTGPSRESDNTSSQMTPDDDFADETYSDACSSAYLSSLTSSIRRGVVENGRTYPSYGRHEYGMPVDEQELDRNDIQHAKFRLLLNNRLFMAPISSEPIRILDIGTASGIWAIDIGDAYPQAQVVGTDIAPVQPTWSPPNVDFFIEDAEDTWTFAPNTFDLVFAREMSFAIRDWPKLMSQAWTVLQPGGWLELSATYPLTHCDDGSLDLKRSYLVQTANIYSEIARAMGTSLEAPYSWAQQLDTAGFVDVQVFQFKMPLGPWPKDKRLKQAGALELASLSEGYEAYLIRGWTQVLKRPLEDCHAPIAEGRKEMFNPRNHTYCYFIVVIGRKPDLPSM